MTYKSAIVSDGNPKYWTNWDNLQWVTLKEPNKVIFDQDGGFYFQAVEDIPYCDGHTLNTRHDWEGAVEYGCDCCGSIPDFAERHKLLWLRPLQFICPTCVEKPVFAQEKKA